MKQQSGGGGGGGGDGDGPKCKAATVAVTPKGWKASAATNDGKNYLLAVDEINKFGTL
jgi:hypothetical protein